MYDGKLGAPFDIETPSPMLLCPCFKVTCSYNGIDWGFELSKETCSFVKVVILKVCVEVSHCLYQLWLSLSLLGYVRAAGSDKEFIYDHD
jgi:hypothetical protein